MTNLKQLRIAAKLTQDDLAQATGLSVSTIRDIEQSRTAYPNHATRTLLQNIFPTEITYTIPKRHRGPNTTQAKPPITTPQGYYRSLLRMNEESLWHSFEQARQQGQHERLHLIAAVALRNDYTTVVNLFLAMFNRPLHKPNRSARGH